MRRCPAHWRRSVGRPAALPRLATGIGASLDIVCAHDRPRLFANMTAGLSAAGTSIIDAPVATLPYRTIADRHLVEDLVKDPLQTRHQRIEEPLLRGLHSPGDWAALPQHGPLASEKHSDGLLTWAEVEFDTSTLPRRCSKGQRYADLTLQEVQGRATMELFPNSDSLCVRWAEQALHLRHSGEQ